MESIYNMLIALPAILIALTFHEYAHGKVADLLGDSTPYYQGRLTLNPLPHIDWVGFLMLFLFHFGWAKPVQVNPYNFKNISYKKGMMLVSLAGPAMNLLLAFLGLIALKMLGLDLKTGQYSGTMPDMVKIVVPLVSINVFLAIFNLIPIPPLDGSKILAGLLPDTGTKLMYSLEQYGPLLLLLLIVTNTFSVIISPTSDLIINFFVKILS